MNRIKCWRVGLLPGPPARRTREGNRYGCLVTLPGRGFTTSNLEEREKEGVREREERQVNDFFNTVKRPS